MRKYLKNLSGEILDEHNLFVELLLSWIGVMLTLIFICAILGLLK